MFRWFLLVFDHLLISNVIGIYEVEVIFDLYENPAGRVVNSRCCDANSFRNCPSNTCDTYVGYCIRPLGSTALDCLSNPIITETSVDTNFLMLPGQVLTANSAWGGINFFLQAVDEDSNSDDDVIDNFSIDITVPVGTSLPQTKYTGIAGIAELTLSFSVRCADDFYGQDCLTMCENFQSCTGCDLSEFTGEFCQFNTSGCASINCNGNGQCVDGFSMCTCNPGYTGTNCEVDIDECVSVNCSGNGECVDGQNSFLCVCREGFTGQLCESSIVPVPGGSSGVGSVVGGVVGGIVAVLVLAIVVVIVLLLVIKYSRGRKETTINGDTIVMTPNQVYGVSVSAVQRSQDKIEMKQNEVYGLVV